MDDKKPARDIYEVLGMEWLRPKKGERSAAKGAPIGKNGCE